LDFRCGSKYILGFFASSLQEVLLFLNQGWIWHCDLEFKKFPESFCRQLFSGEPGWLEGNNDLHLKKLKCGILSIGFSAGLSGRKNFAKKWDCMFGLGILFTVICVYCGDYSHNVKLDCRLWLHHFCWTMLLLVWGIRLVSIFCMQFIFLVSSCGILGISVLLKKLQVKYFVRILVIVIKIQILGDRPSADSFLTWTHGTVNQRWQRQCEHEFSN